jgi:hypothetical protein
LDTNSGSPLGAICSTIAEAFDFGRDKALRFDTFFLGRLAGFAGVALTFFEAADFLAFFGLATDLTGSFCTKRNVRNRLGKEFCHAEEEV